MTSIEVGEFIVHADPSWNGGQGATRSAAVLVVSLHLAGRETPHHVIHVRTGCCAHCPERRPSDSALAALYGAMLARDERRFGGAR